MAFCQDKVALEKKQIELLVGIDKIIKLNFTTERRSIRVGNSSVLEFSLVRYGNNIQEIILKGIKPGPSSLDIRTSDGVPKLSYQVRVVANKDTKVVQELKEFLGEIEGLEIGIKGGKVYIDGEIIVPKDIGRITLVLSKYPDVLNFVEVSPQTKRIISTKMQEAIQKNGFRDVTVRVVNSNYWLEGIVTAADAQEGNRKFLTIENIAKAYLPDNIQSLASAAGRFQNANQSFGRSLVQNFINISIQSKPPPLDKLIKITAQFVELTKSYSRVFGFKWNPLLAGTGGEISFGKGANGGVTTNSSNTLSGTISNLFPKLETAKSAGNARIIQSGMVIAKNSTVANISKTTERQLSLGSGEFSKNTTLRATFSLGIVPEILQGEQVNLDVQNLTISSIDQTNETVNNTLKTIVIVKSKESAVIGGIVQNKSQTEYDKGNPNNISGGQALFTFLRSKEYISQRNQYVMFITPEILESASQGTNDIKRKFRRRGR